MYTVVVADDEQELRQSLIRRVSWEEAGFEVVGEAANGAEALELVEKLEPDLLLSDIRMPFMTGIELARAVREIRPTMHIAFLSGFDDFSYAQQAIQYNIVSYMLKPISAKKLTEELKKIKSKIDYEFEEFSKRTHEQEKQNVESFLVPLMLDPFRSAKGDEVNKRLMVKAAEIGIVPSTESLNKYTVMVTSIYDARGENWTTLSSVSSIDSICKKYIKYTSFFSAGRVISLLSGTEAALNKYLHIIVGDISQSVKRIMNLDTSIGVSRVVPRLIDCHDAYVEAMNAMTSSKISNESVTFITDIERSNAEQYNWIQSAVTEIETLIRGADTQELESYLDRIFDKIEKDGVSRTVLNSFAVQLVATIFKVVQNSDIEMLDTLQQMSPLERGNYSSFGEIKEQCSAFCAMANALISEQRKKSGSDICQSAIDIIENKYMDPTLSLVSISNEISVSPNYLSALIKKSTGSTFIELLTKKRIETGKRLIAATGMKIREVSEMCGYSDQHYFSYCFKKYVGQSPKSFRIECESNEKREA